MPHEHEQPSDEELASRARGGDRRCFETLVERYGTRLVAFLRSVTRSEEDARDLAQQGFVRAYGQLGRYDPNRPFRPWLFTVARRLALDHARKHREAPGRAEEPEPVDLRDPAHLLVRRETTDLLWEWTRGRLTEPQFTAFQLRVNEEWTVREIARVMDLGPTHVRVLLHRARRRLADALVKAGVGAPAEKGEAGPITEAPALLRAARRRKEYGL